MILDERPMIPRRLENRSRDHAQNLVKEIKCWRVISRYVNNQTGKKSSPAHQVCSQSFPLLQAKLVKVCSVQVKILLKFLLSSCRLWLKDEGWLFNQCQWLTWNFKSILTWTQHRGFFYWLRGTWVKKTLSKKPNFWQTDDVSRNPSWLQLVESDAPDEILTTCGKWCTWWNFNTSVEIVFLHC